jgi:hypothetical protein
MVPYLHLHPHLNLKVSAIGNEKERQLVIDVQVRVVMRRPKRHATAFHLPCGGSRACIGTHATTSVNLVTCNQHA